MAELSTGQEYYRKNRERILAAARRRYRTNAAYREYQRRYREAHRAVAVARGRVRYLAKKQGIVLVHMKRGRPAGDPARGWVMLKLRRGDAPLTPKELRWVLPAKRAEATKLKPRTLQAVGELFGLTHERVRQITSQLRK